MIFPFDSIVVNKDMQPDLPNQLRDSFTFIWFVDGDYLGRDYYDEGHSIPKELLGIKYSPGIWI